MLCDGINGAVQHFSAKLSEPSCQLLHAACTPQLRAFEAWSLQELIE